MIKTSNNKGITIIPPKVVQNKQEDKSTIMIHLAAVPNKSVFMLDNFELFIFEGKPKADHLRSKVGEWL